MANTQIGPPTTSRRRMSATSAPVIKRGAITHATLYSAIPPPSSARHPQNGALSPAVRDSLAVSALNTDEQTAPRAGTDSKDVSGRRIAVKRTNMRKAACSIPVASGISCSRGLSSDATASADSPESITSRLGTKTRSMAKSDMAWATMVRVGSTSPSTITPRMADHSGLREIRSSAFAGSTLSRLSRKPTLIPTIMALASRTDDGERTMPLTSAPKLPSLWAPMRTETMVMKA
mmetsp:Transcript_31632/g.82699  ORF Transcript_31632/g.82699 Transcript_31632/m.82699 type:complete len:234 (+) Transcript_31632:525-1226(+)